MACANGRRFPITRYLYDEACGGSPLSFNVELRPYCETW